MQKYGKDLQCTGRVYNVFENSKTSVEDLRYAKQAGESTWNEHKGSITCINGLKHVKRLEYVNGGLITTQRVYNVGNGSTM